MLQNDLDLTALGFLLKTKRIAKSFMPVCHTGDDETENAALLL